MIPTWSHRLSMHHLNPAVPAQPHRQWQLSLSSPKTQTLNHSCVVGSSHLRYPTPSTQSRSTSTSTQHGDRAQPPAPDPSRTMMFKASCRNMNTVATRVTGTNQSIADMGSQKIDRAERATRRRDQTRARFEESDRSYPLRFEHNGRMKTHPCRHLPRSAAIRRRDEMKKGATGPPALLGRRPTWDADDRP